MFECGVAVEDGTEGHRVEYWATCTGVIERGDALTVRTAQGYA